MYALWDEMESLMKRQMEARRTSVLSELRESRHSPDEQAIPTQSESSPTDSRYHLDDGVQAAANLNDESLVADFPPISTTEVPEANTGTEELAVDDIGLGGLCDDGMIHDPVNIHVQQDDPSGLDNSNHWVPDPPVGDGSMMFGTNIAFPDVLQMLGHESARHSMQQHRGRQLTQTNALMRSRSATPFSGRQAGNTSNPSMRPTAKRSRRGTTPHLSTQEIHHGLLGAMEHFDDFYSACIGQYFPPMSPPSFPPAMSFPTLLGDEGIHTIIERAKENPGSVGPPTLEDFLFDNPRNTLSTDLKNYLAPVRQTRKVSEFLATYWVIYLLFRVRFPAALIHFTHAC